MLSEENKKKLLDEPKALYRHKPYGSLASRTMGAYHCRNWIFTVRDGGDGRVYMIDTYYDDWDSRIEVTDDNINDFEFLFRKGEYFRDTRYEYHLYNPEDVIKNVATDSGGYSCGSTTWIRKGAKKIPEKVLKDLRYEVDSAFRRFQSAIRYLNQQEEELDLPLTDLESYVLKEMLK